MRMKKNDWAAWIGLAAMFLAGVFPIFAGVKEQAEAYVVIKSIAIPLVATGSYSASKSYPFALIAYIVLAIIDTLVFKANVSLWLVGTFFAAIGASLHELYERLEKRRHTIMLLEPERSLTNNGEIIVRYSQYTHPGGELHTYKEIRSSDNMNFKFEHKGLIIDAMDYIGDTMKEGRSYKRFALHYMTYNNYKYEKETLYMDVIINNVD